MLIRLFLLRRRNRQKKPFRGGKFRFFPPLRTPPIKTTFSSSCLLQIFCLAFMKKRFLLVGKICSVVFVVIFKLNCCFFNCFHFKLVRSSYSLCRFCTVSHYLLSIKCSARRFFTDKTTVNLAVISLSMDADERSLSLLFRFFSLQISADVI